MEISPHPYLLSWQKRTFDLTLSFFLVIVFSPLIILIATVIFLKSGWPVLYTQKRLGKDKKPFTIYKFRTMINEADKLQKKHLKLNQAPNPMFKIFNDPRFTGIGRWLSKTGLDELPQLLNIIKGDMSIVGPRPLPISEAKKLNTSWNFRYTVKPGVISEWTLSENRHTSLKTWKNLDKLSLKSGGFNYEAKIITALIEKTLSDLFFLSRF